MAAKVLAGILAPAFADELDLAKPYLQNSDYMPIAVRRTLSLCLRLLYQSCSLSDADITLVKRVVPPLANSKTNMPVKDRRAIATLIQSFTSLRDQINQALDAREVEDTPLDEGLQSKMDSLKISADQLLENRIQATLCNGVDLHPALSTAFHNSGIYMETHGFDENGRLRIGLKVQSQNDFKRKFSSTSIQLGGRSVTAEQVLDFVTFEELAQKPTLALDNGHSKRNNPE
jgi:hypothetical protein